MTDHAGNSYSPSLAGNAFTQTVPLQAGLNTLTVNATDLAGNTGSAVRTVIQDSDKPSLAVTNPDADAVVRAATLTIEGDVSDALTAVTVAIDVDTQSFAPALEGNGHFSQEITLPEEALYPVLVTATDEVGNATQVLRNVYYTQGIVTLNAGAEFARASAATANLSYAPGFTAYRLCLDGTTWGTWTVMTTAATEVNKGVTLPTGNGLKTVYAQFRTANGTESLIYADTIVLDATAPAGAITINDGAVLTGNPAVTVTLVAADDSGVAEVQLSSSSTTWPAAWTPFAAQLPFTLGGADGTKTVYARFRDAAGNVSAAISDTIVYRQGVSPAAGSGGVVTINGGAAYATATAATLTLTKPEDAVTQMALSTDGTTWGAWAAFASPKAVTLPTGDGVKTVYAKFKTAVATLPTIYSDSIVLDTLAPAGSVLINNGAAVTNSAAVTLTLAGIDLNGVAKMRFSENGTTWSGWENYATTRNFTFTGADGAKTISVQFQDGAGKISATLKDGIVLDRAAPGGTLKINAGAAATRSGTVTLALTATGSPAQMRFSNDNGAWGAWLPFATSKAGWVLAAGDGTRTVSAQFRDAAGNLSGAISDTIQLDTTAPTPGTVVINQNAAWTNKTAATLTLAGSSDLTALKVQTSLNNGATWSAPTAYPVSNTLNVTLPTGSGVKTVQVRYQDAVGNVSSVISDSITLDTVAPALPAGAKVKINNDAATVSYATASNGALPLTLTVPEPTDAGGSGMVAILWSASNTDWATRQDVAWASGNPVANGKEFTINYPMAAPTTNAIKTVYIKFKDAAGNLSAAASDTITVTK
ncbi:MAG: hypothetical protein FDZ69_11855 [Deltaproteobacteria bacterium]|nr:MAG: hypothetical protein FDZ69_11855 [Deltaproteobacteria bacterium]